MADPLKRSTTLLIGGMILFALLFPSSAFSAAILSVDHRLEIELLPGSRKLIGRDRVRVEGVNGDELSFHLSARAKNLQVFVNGSQRPFRFSHSELLIPLEPRDRSNPFEVEIQYEALFDDPVPQSPMNTDNPGFGVTATISEEGVFLLSGSGWYPELDKSRATYTLQVRAPRGIVAVTAGRSLRHESVDQSTISEWRVEHPVEGLSLSAARYELHAESGGDVPILLYLLPQSRDLAPAYLKAAAEYVRFYSDLFGPYPFPKFAVVENFFPTGYGFPSYTLLGSTVLRLPFILTTSLGHEIAHSWWGNGVWVDENGGNWSEGLTTYVSDYLYKERQSEEEGRDYRLQAIRNYTTLVPPDQDFPLSRFISRTDPVTKAVGYDKGAMVFHMLRRAIGEEPFWGALRDIFRERQFQPTSWKDLQLAFEKRAGPIPAILLPPVGGATGWTGSPRGECSCSSGKGPFQSGWDGPAAATPFRCECGCRPGVRRVSCYKGDRDSGEFNEIRAGVYRLPQAAGDRPGSPPAPKAGRCRDSPHRELPEELRIDPPDCGRGWFEWHGPDARHLSRVEGVRDRF